MHYKRRFQFGNAPYYAYGEAGDPGEVGLSASLSGCNHPSAESGTDAVASCDVEFVVLEGIHSEEALAADTEEP